MLSLQAHASGDDENLKRHLREASSRVATIARAHERLYQTNDIEELDVSAYIKVVCADLPTNAGVSVVTEAAAGIRLSTDRAISLALIVAELVTNANKYAYPDSRGIVWVSLAQQGEMLVASVRDDGRGVPADFTPEKSSGLGMRIIRALSDQLDGELTVQRLDKGTSFTLRIPLQPRA